MFRITTILVPLALAFLCGIDACVAQGVEPTASEILRNYVEALGGEEMLNSVTSMKLTATQTSHVREAEEEGTFESTDTLLVSDGRSVVRSSLGGQSGFDGTRYWSKHKNGQLEWREDVRYPFNYRDPVSYPLHLLNFPGTLEFGGHTQFGGKPAVRLAVALQPPNHGTGFG